ncbi:MAG: dihydroneopterin aldolase [Cycloclasticus sp.]|nr:dihydroneopterin aldolase [Cycloclasticus sp. 44_32_T64]
MDIIFLRNLRIETIIGIFDWERTVKQPVFFDLEMATDIKKAAASDHIDDTLDYKSLSKAVIDFVEKSNFQLVETLAERVAELIINDFNVPWLRLTLNKKGALRHADDVGIIIERGNKP